MPDSGSAPIHFAALHNNASILAKLLEAKAMSSLENEQHLTALKIAAVQGSMSFAKVLVQHQANARFSVNVLDDGDDNDSQEPPQDDTPTAKSENQNHKVNSAFQVASNAEGDEANTFSEADDITPLGFDRNTKLSDDELMDPLDADQDIDQEEAFVEIETRLQDELCDGSKTAQISMVLTALVAVLVVLVAVLIAAWTRQGDQIAQLRQQIARLKADPTCSVRPPIN
eukprot:INCI6315.1.p2 GENE.INCI6315.1~~INCI6315.1.p2  ORF type:complete len:228 (-),score=62.45 INCI6315.1:23-706(-)